MKNLQQTHSKVKHIKYNDLEIAPYLIDSNFKNDDKFLLFKLRTSMVNVKGNFSHSYQDTTCNLCQKDEPQTQEHLLECTELIKNCSQLFDNRNILYKDLFEGKRKQLRCTQLFKNILETKKLIEERSYS